MIMSKPWIGQFRPRLGELQLSMNFVVNEFSGITFINASNVLNSLSQFSRSCGLTRIRLLTDDDQIRSEVRALSGGRPAFTELRTEWN